MILFFRLKAKSNLSQKILENGIFCLFGKGGITFSYKYNITLLSKKQGWFSSEKNTLKDDIFGIIEKVDIHPRKMVLLLIEKLKMIKKFTFIKMFQWFSVTLKRPL